MNARSCAPSRSSSAASAKPSTTSVLGRTARCRSACSAILVRSGSMTTSCPPLRFALRDLPHQMQIRDRRVVAPHDIELRVRRRVRADARHRAIGPGPGLRAHRAAHRAAIEQRGAELVEEAQRHAVHRQHAVRARRSSAASRPAGRACAITSGHARMDRVERLVPRDALEAPGAARAGAPHRIHAGAARRARTRPSGARPCCRSRPPCRAARPSRAP